MSASERAKRLQFLNDMKQILQRAKESATDLRDGLIKLQKKAKN